MSFQGSYSGSVQRTLSRAQSFHSTASRASMASQQSNVTYLSMASGRSHSSQYSLVLPHDPDQAEHDSFSNSIQAAPEDFTIVNGTIDRAKLRRQAREEQHSIDFGAGFNNDSDLKRHELGYPLAMPHLCKMMKTKKETIELSGGCPITRRGFVLLSTLKRHQRRKFFELSNGKLRMYSVLKKSKMTTEKEESTVIEREFDAKRYSDGDPVPSEFLSKEATYGIQRVQAIRYTNPKAKSFTLVILKSKKNKQGLQTGMKSMMKTLGRIRSMSGGLLSEGGRSIKSQRSANSRKSIKSMQSTKYTERSNIRKSKARKVRMPKTGSFLSISISKLPSMTRRSSRRDMQPEEAGSDRKEYSERSASKLAMNLKKTKPKKKRQQRSKTAILPKTSPQETEMPGGVRFGTQVSLVSSDSYQTQHTHQLRQRGSFKRNFNKGTFMSNPTEKSHSPSVVEQNVNTLLLRDEAGNLAEAEEEYLTMNFKTVEKCHDWLRCILIEVENQAMLIETYSKIIEQKGQDNNDKVEVMTRKALDLYTLAKGIRSRKVWELRESLGTFLEDRGDVVEARVWFELSYFLRSDDGNLYTVLQDAEQGRATSSFSSLGTIMGKKGKSSNILAARPKSRDEASNRLMIFLEQYGRGDVVQNAKELSQYYMATYQLAEISRKLEAEYGRVPDGFECYLIDLGKPALDRLRDQLPPIKISLLQTKMNQRQMSRSTASETVASV